MNTLTRPPHRLTSHDGALPLNSPSAVRGPASYFDWLATLKRQDVVRVRNGDMTMPAAMVTNETPCYVFVDKLKFHRRNGWQVERQGKRVYRMRLRLVRDERDCT